MKIKTKLFGLFLVLYIIPFVITIVADQLEVGSQLNSLVSLSLQFCIPLLVVAPLVLLMSKKITDPLKILTDSAGKIAHGDLDERVDIYTDDEFGDLAETFNDMADSLQKHTQTLAASLVELKEETERANEATEEVAMSAQYMDCATNEAQHLIEQLFQEQDFSLRFDNPELVKCWEVRSCNKSNCPAYENEDQRCWHIQGTFCHNQEAMGTTIDKFSACQKCNVYQQSTVTRLYQLGEVFNYLLQLLEEGKRAVEIMQQDDELTKIAVNQ